MLLSAQLKHAPICIYCFCHGRCCSAARSVRTGTRRGARVSPGRFRSAASAAFAWGGSGAATGRAREVASRQGADSSGGSDVGNQAYAPWTKVKQHVLTTEGTTPVRKPEDSSFSVVRYAFCRRWVLHFVLSGSNTAPRSTGTKQADFSLGSPTPPTIIYSILFILEVYIFVFLKCTALSHADRYMCPPPPPPITVITLPRRSTGAMNLQLVAPAGSTTAQNTATTTAVRENGRRRGKDKGRPLRSQAVVDNSNLPLCTDATNAIKETTGTTRGDRGDTDHGKSMLSSRHPAREGKDHSRSSSMATTNIDAVGTTTVNERHQRRGRGTETLSREGLAAGGGGGQEEFEGRLTVVRVKQARGDNTRGLSAATRTNAATAPHESPPPATEVTDERQEAVAAAATTGTHSLSVAETSATAAVPATVTDITSTLTKQEAAYERWPATLDARWAEVEFMLCHEVESEESLRLTTEATQAGLVFMKKLEKKAQVTHILYKGQSRIQYSEVRCTRRLDVSS